MSIRSYWIDARERAARRSETLARKLKRAGCDPFAILAAFALDKSDPDRRLKAACELAQYMQPKLKAIEIDPHLVEKPKCLAIE